MSVIAHLVHKGVTF